MTRDEVKAIVLISIKEVLGELNEELDIKKGLVDYGANSIDRADITVRCLELMKMESSLVSFGDMKNIEELIEALYEKQS